MSNVMVFDRLPQNDTEKDFWRAAFPDMHDVVGGSTTLHGSVDRLVAMRAGELAIPDVLLVGDRLASDTHHYVEQPRELPLAQKAEDEIFVRKKYGLRAARIAMRSLVLLPGARSYNEHGTTLGPIMLSELRENHRRDDMVKIRARYDAAIRHPESNLSAAPGIFIIGHTARLLLKERCPRIIGISDNHLPSLHAPVDARVSRMPEDAAWLRRLIIRAA